MKKKVILIWMLAILFVTFSPMSFEKYEFNDDERNIISSLYDIRMIGRVEVLCNDWNEWEDSNMQLVYLTGMYTELKQRLGEDRFYRYYNESKKETTSAVYLDLMQRWKSEGEFETLAAHCKESIPAWRVGFANVLMNSTSAILKE